MSEHIPFIRIFIASPSDVNEERKIAMEVIERLPYRPAFREKVAFRVIAWDKPGTGTPMRAALTPQEAINMGLPTPAECDIVVVVFWSRMGTPFTHTDGKAYLSGTHWELLNALEAKRPETVIYRRTESPPLKVSDPDFDDKLAQYKLVNAFFDSDLFYGSDGKIKRGINTYQTADDFQRNFEMHLEVLVLDILKRFEAPSLPERDVKDNDNISTIRAEAWNPAKSPFPGLRRFGEDDANIFFGREVETSELIKRIEMNRFTAIVAASGSGKSSLIAAGLIPRLKANAIVTTDTGSKDWRFVRFTPGQEATPFAGLFTALRESFPEYKVSPLEHPKLKKSFVDSIVADPRAFVEICNSLLRAAKTPVWAEILFFIDQFEELFTLVSETDRGSFVSLLETIGTSQRLRCVVTIRSDYYVNCLEIPGLAGLMQTASYPLAMPTAGALVKMITRPAERAGLVWDEGLPERIQSDTGTDSGSLALMSYTLDELYKVAVRRDDGRLTFADYSALDGVRGAVGRRAENVFTSLTLPDKETVVQHVFRELIEVDESGRVSRRRVLQGRFTEQEMLLVRSFTDARLLVMDQEYVEIAHEALFRGWERIKVWIDWVREDLVQLRQVRSDAANWERNARNSDFLWRGRRLDKVIEMLNRLNPHLDATTQAFIQASSDRMFIQPLFGMPSNAPQFRSDVFMLMPFSDDLAPVYRDHIRIVAESAGFSIKRADDFFSTHSIMDDIWAGIANARLIIADCTFRNANVFYELGVAHTLGKTTIMITQERDNIPFDLRHLRFLLYEFTPRGMKEFELQILAAIRAVNLEQSAPVRSELVVAPIYGLPDQDSQYNADVFMVMPFRENLQPIYTDHIRGVITRLGLTIKRGDDFFSRNSIMKDIWSAIYASKLVIADCTDRNANVFYEIGIAHTLGKPTIIITQKPEDVPYDLQHHRYIYYKYTPPGMKLFEETLAEAIKLLNLT